MKTRLLLAFFTSTFALSPSVGAQTAETLVRVLDALPETGTIGAIDNVWVLDEGSWFVRGERAGASPPFFALRDGTSIPG